MKIRYLPFLMSRLRINSKKFKEYHQNRLDEKNRIVKEKLQEEQRKLKEKNKKEEIKIIFESNKSDWKKEINLQESDWTPVAGSIANSSSQTFQYPGGSTVTVSGLGGVEGTPSTVTVTQSGDTFDVSAPDYSQLGLQGYAPPLGGVQRQTKQTENERIDAEIIKLEEQIKQLQQKISDLGEEQIATEPQYTGMSHGDYIDKTNEINDKWNEKTGPLGEIIYGGGSESEKKVAYAKLDVYERARIKELDALDAQYKNQTEASAKAQNDHFAAYTAKVDSALAKQEVLRVKIAELEKQRPINQQLDAAQQAYPNLPFMGGRVQGVRQQPSFNYDPSKMGRTSLADIASTNLSGLLRDPNANNDVPIPDDDLLDQLANMFGVGSAKNFVDHYIDNFVKGDGKQDQNLTKLLTKDDRQYLETELPIKDMQNNFTQILKGKIDSQTKINQINAAIRQVLEDGPEGIQNSLGRGVALDIEYFKKTGDFKLDKTYQFTSKDDLGYRSGGNLMSHFKSLFTKGYTSGKMPRGDVSPLIQNPMRYHVIIPGPRRKKKKEEEVVESTTWSRLKKHR